MESLQVYAGDGRAPADFNKYDADGRQHGWWYTGGELPRSPSDADGLESLMIKFNHGTIEGPCWASLRPLNRHTGAREYFAYGMAAEWDPKAAPKSYPSLSGWWVFHNTTGVSQGLLDRNRKNGVWYYLLDDERPYTQRYSLAGAPLTGRSSAVGEKAGWTKNCRPSHLESIEAAWRALGIPQERQYDFSEVQNPYYRFEGL